MRKRFNDLVAGHAESQPRLPLVHTTDAYLFANAADSGQLKPRRDDVFKGENLIYLFYGRPAYRANSRQGPGALSHYLPLCLIFSKDTPLEIKRVFPFDSGAFADGLYGPFIHHAMSLEDFSLHVDPSSPGRLISMYYNSVDSYLNATPDRSPGVGPSDFEALSYKALISDSSANSRDDRISGIEIQTNHTIPLEFVEAIVLPNSYAEDYHFKAILEKFKIAPLPYRQHERAGPSEYTTTIYDIVRSYYESTIKI